MFWFLTEHEKVFVVFFLTEIPATEKMLSTHVQYSSKHYAEIRSCVVFSSQNMNVGFLTLNKKQHSASKYYIHLNKLTYFKYT